MDKIIVAASRNRHKIEEIEAITQKFGMRIISRDEAGIPPVEIVEDGETFEENSLKKAKERIHVLDDSIQIKAEKKYSNTVADGKVISQSIAANTRFSPGAIPKITLTVSKGAQSNSTPPPSSPRKTREPTSTDAEDFDIKTKPSKDSFQID